MGKRIISILLAVFLVFTFSVVSFGATPTQGVTVSNFPQYFTGAYDLAISNDLYFVRIHCENIASNLEDITLDINDINANVALIPNAISVTNGLLSDFKLLFNNFYTAFENIILTTYDDYHNETIGAIGGVTSAVNRVNGTVSSFKDDFNWQSDINNKYSLGYSLYMLQQVLADEKDLANKRKAEQVNDQSLSSVLDVNNKINTSNIVDGLTMSNDFVSMIDFGFSFEELFNILDHDTSPDLWGWFTQSTKDNMYGVVSPAVFSSRSYSGVPNVEEPLIVTDYYNENINQVLSFFGGGNK